MGLVGGYYQFLCQGWIADDNVIVKWFLNGTEDHNKLYATTDFNLSPYSSIIEFRNASILLHNTKIMCSVVFPSGKICNSTVSTLLIQGTIIVNTILNF